MSTSVSVLVPLYRDEQSIQPLLARLEPVLHELGEDAESTERQLHRWRFHPGIAREATAWAWRRHQDALAAVTATATTDA